MAYNKRSKYNSNALSFLGRRTGQRSERGVYFYQTTIELAEHTQAAYGRNAPQLPPALYAHARRLQVIKKQQEETAVRVFEFNGMRFEVHVKERGELDLQHIKVIIPNKPSHNAEVIHQFSILNKVRRRHLQPSDFTAAYEQEVVKLYMTLLPDEREVVFNLLTAEYNAL